MYLLVPKQRLDEAEAELELTLGADPLSPDYHAQLAQIHLFKRQFDRAEEKARAAIELKSNYPFAYWLVGVIRALQGRFDQAISNCENAIQLFGGAPVAIAAVGTLLGWAGCVAEAGKMLERVEAAARTSYVSSVARAWIHMGLGETDKVFEWLDRAVDERDPQITHLPVKPIYDSLRADPRFAALLHKMRL
jgi:tetratricopeptide (TPR) repeat protein